MSYLVHHGILGQRWGIRRYQNPDGTLTEEGRRRYGDSEEARIRVARGRAAGRAALVTGAAAAGYALGRKTDDKNIDSTKNSIKSTKESVNTFRDIATQQNKADASERAYFEAHNMTDQQLKDAVARKALEKKYVDLSQESVSYGHDQVDRFLATTSAVLGVVGAGVTVAAAIRNFKNGGGGKSGEKK